jgi:hypothetical protein
MSYCSICQRELLCDWHQKRFLTSFRLAWKYCTGHSCWYIRPVCFWGLLRTARAHQKVIRKHTGFSSHLNQHCCSSCRTGVLHCVKWVGRVLNAELNDLFGSCLHRPPPLFPIHIEDIISKGFCNASVALHVSQITQSCRDTRLVGRYLCTAGVISTARSRFVNLETQYSSNRIQI